jgi:hypothetical protein
MMVQATILITSGSSFADAAAMLTKNIVIYTYHEDRKFNDYNRLLRFINIESGGNFILFYLPYLFFIYNLKNN